ncbi:hypothetical protein, variant 1 [Sphaeroforma arctica JP610]|uniref:PNPLA domain-containing protein n=1 Tax=Sphaeroforma arctica JP610 TaxID=667725 RepID=A0A0L0FJ72_9EUKA|nr:hypothetical protein, variant 1 [Sphaeroforma arctica JP610]KNC76834.1 hypothetical protein, variant 1 [Sphaeroforma arctica JP610]|eukprot:XP_014150736.1 hypothetical protein, variant 1 [Sphaeroforma arctica JP610]
MSDRNDVSKDSQLSFSFAALYQFETALALKHFDVSKRAKFVGSSAGALTAAAIILDVDLIRLKDTPFQLRKYKTDIADEMLGPARFLSNQSKLSEQLEVVVTVLPRCHTLRYSKYRNYEHFKDVMLASCTASPIAGFPFLLSGYTTFSIRVRLMGCISWKCY